MAESQPAPQMIIWLAPTRKNRARPTPLWRAHAFFNHSWSQYENYSPTALCGRDRVKWKKNIHPGPDYPFTCKRCLNLAAVMRLQGLIKGD